MAWTPWVDVPEEGVEPTPLPEPITSLSPVPGEPPLNPRYRVLLSHLYEGMSLKDAAKAVGLTYKHAQKVVAQPSFKRAVEVQDQAFVDRVARGEFGAMAVAKVHLVENINALQHMARNSKNERVRLSALQEMIQLAGFQPPKPQVTESPERIIDQMTGEEAEAFANTGEWPARLRDQAARLPTATLHQHDPEVVIGEVITKESPQQGEMEEEE